MFPYDPQRVKEAEIGMLTGSLLSALTRYMILRSGSSPARAGVAGTGSGRSMTPGIQEPVIG
jgi:hypothetical protein